MEFDFEPFRNVIVCSYKNTQALKARFPKKRLLPDKYCPDRIFYYINQNGIVRHYEVKTGRLVDLCTGRFSSVYVNTPYKVKPIE